MGTCRQDCKYPWIQLVLPLKASPWRLPLRRNASKTNDLDVNNIDLPNVVDFKHFQTQNSMAFIHILIHKK